MTKAKIQLVEVGPRDGLQNEKKVLTISDRLELIKKLAHSGLQRIEIGAFVSKKWVPQMEGSETLIARVLAEQKQGRIPSSVQFSVLVPNLKGMEMALQSGVKEIAIFGSCTESFSQKNINCSIAESFIRFRQVSEVARAHKIKVRGYLSMAFGCPYEGAVDQARVVRLIRAFLKLGVYEISIGDTIGVATPLQVEQIIKKIKKISPLNKIAMHFHDTRGTALANVLMSLQNGVRTFDSSVGGLGGCPYAAGASGNLATEDLIYMLDGMGLKHGAQLKKLKEMRPWLESLIGRKLPGKVI